MKYILFISLLFISCSKNSESNSSNEDESLASETEQVSNDYYEIYLLEQLNENSGVIKRKSIKESASAPVSSTKPSKESSKVISEEAVVADRFRKLAGILKG